MNKTFRPLNVRFRISQSVNYAGKKKLSRRALQQAAEALINDSEELGPKDFQEIEAVKAVVASFMHEMECILHEYLSFHWDRTDDIFDANRDASVGGLFARASMLTVSLSSMNLSFSRNLL